MTEGRFTIQRRQFHQALLADVLSCSEGGIPSNADTSNGTSKALALGILDRLLGEGPRRTAAKLKGQELGHRFEVECEQFLQATFGGPTAHLRPGKWEVRRTGSKSRMEIARYYQYEHLELLEALAKESPPLRTALGSDYTITPDIIVSRMPEPDEVLNAEGRLVDESSARAASLRKGNNRCPILHASISCKWTVRSDRAQNSRSEALNLVKNRKGAMPHAVVVTGEPLPSRLASLALGTGEIDCVYHFALYELQAAAEELGNDDTTELLRIMVEGRRLKDISDLPLDLAV